MTLSGLGATLGLAVTGAIFNELLVERTVSLAGERGIAVSRGEAQELDGVLAGASGAERTLKTISGGRGAEAMEAVREAFVSALGSALKLSAMLVLIGLVLAVVLLRRTSPADAAPVDPVVGAPTPRPAPRVGVRVPSEDRPKATTGIEPV